MSNDNAIINWKCFDNIDVTPNELFCNSAYKVDESYTPYLKEVFSAVSSKYEKMMSDRFVSEKRHFQVAGGNYTAFFVLPYIFKFFSRSYPFLPISISLFETNSPKELRDSRLDAILTSSQAGINEWQRGVEKYGYVRSRKGFLDEARLACSKESLKKYGSKEETLRRHDLIFARKFNKFDRAAELKYTYAVSPPDRKPDDARISLDFHYMGHQFMVEDYGIWFVFKKERKQENVCLLGNEILAHFKRFFLYKKGTKKNYKARLYRFIRVAFNEKNKP